MKSRFSILFGMCLFLVMACEEGQIVVDNDCFVADVIEINPFLGCQPSEIPGNDKDEFHKLVLINHPTLDTIYTRLFENHYQTGEEQIRVRIDSLAHLNLLCNALNSLDYPRVWVTKQEDGECD